MNPRRLVITAIGALDMCPAGLAALEWPGVFWTLKDIDVFEGVGQRPHGRPDISL